MLKATGDIPPPGGERSFGELATQLVDDAKAYARAEVDLAKAIATDKTRSIKLAAVYFGAALLVAVAAMTALGVAVVVGLATLMSPALAGLVAFVLISAVAAVLAWLGAARLKDAV